MARFECSICSAPPDVLVAVNDALIKGESGRKIAKRSAFSKSALYRHRAACIPKSIVSRHRDRIAAAQKPGRFIVQWPDDYNGPALTTARRGDCLPFDEDFNENDILIVVRFVATPLHEIGNPSALLTEDLRNEAFAEHAERFPDAVIACEAETVEEVLEEAKVCNTNIRLDATPSEGGDRKNDTLSNCELVTAKSAVVAKLPTVGNLPSECQHVMVRVSGDISRCQNCGYQTQPDFVFGVSRKWWNERHGVGRTRFGRFG